MLTYILFRSNKNHKVLYLYYSQTQKNQVNINITKV